MGDKDLSRDKKPAFVCCEKCGKKLLERMPNGCWHFRFGRDPNSSEPVVDIVIYGSLQFKCTRRSCRHINVLNFFPDTFKVQSPFTGTNENDLQS